MRATVVALLALALVGGCGGDGDGPAYRWSSDRFFTTAVEDESLAPDDRLTFDLVTDALEVEPGEYELEATLAAKPAKAPLRRSITVS